jgi:type II secretory pathway predicted ATPase ExeA
MNLNFFGLRQTPFGDTDSSSMFWTAKRQDLATLFRRALVERQGMLVLTGEEGSGKTTSPECLYNSRKTGSSYSTLRGDCAAYARTP